jgi:hypothetical protein
MTRINLEPNIRPIAFAAASSGGGVGGRQIGVHKTRGRIRGAGRLDGCAGRPGPGVPLEPSAEPLANRCLVIVRLQPHPESPPMSRSSGPAETRCSGVDWIGVGKACASPPSEPCVRFSRTRLSSRLFPHRDRLARAWAVVMVNSPCAAKKAFVQRRWSCREWPRRLSRC